MLALLTAFALVSQVLPYTGTNLSGGEFYQPKPNERPVYGKNFTYPTTQELVYFSHRGMNVFRIGFLWETLQPEPKKPLDAVELKRLVDIVKAATKMRITVLLDPHNYARYYGKPVGTAEVPDEAFADFWRRLAVEFKSDARVWFGLVNEPHSIPAAQWVTSANAAIRQIRSAGAKNLILVPGVAYTGAWTWSATWYGEPNSVALDRIVDPGHNYAIEVHQYLDSDGSGTNTQIVSPTVGSERITDFVKWCRTRKLKAFLGEFAVGNTPEGKVALENMLTSMERDRDVWLGFTWWSAGPWWGDYMFSIEPKDGVDKPQMVWLAPHLRRGD